MTLRIQKTIAWPMCLIFLVGLTFSVTGYVLCIGDDGHTRFKTICLPCCSDAEEVCDVDVSDDISDEHSNCINCSDLSLDELLWSKRFQKTGFIQSVKSFMAPTFHAVIIPISTDNGNSQAGKFLLTFSQSPLSASIATTILRC